MAFVERNSNELIYMTAPNISAAHAFTTRLGGVSRGMFESLNLGRNLGDEPDYVRENYRRLCNALNISEADIVCQKQVHGTDVRTVTDADRGKLYAVTVHEGDGLITDSPGTALMVFIADCVPILMHDSVRGAIGAVHAGWRGTSMDIAGAAVNKMKRTYGCTDISAAIGPSISRCCFETDFDVADALYDTLGDAAKTCVQPNADKFMIDLKEANRLMLIRAGIQAHNITVSDECTICKSGKYWSHRRMGQNRGSQAAIIVMKGNET